jgi:8-oxo-dGTP pyrophosphatase MutT (NUDIX family)
MSGLTPLLECPDVRPDPIAHIEVTTMRQFTATAYIIKDQKTLLIFHKKLNKWLPPGGHLDPYELPPEGAKREAWEETGLEIELLHQENIWIESWNAKSFARPYLCLLEEIPATPSQPAHQHIDFIYVAKPVGGTEKHNHEEIHKMQWFSLNEIENLESDVEIFEETKQTLRKILMEKSDKEHHSNIHSLIGLFGKGEAS